MRRDSADVSKPYAKRVGDQSGMHTQTGLHPYNPFTPEKRLASHARSAHEGMVDPKCSACRELKSHCHVEVTR